MLRAYAQTSISNSTCLIVSLYQVVFVPWPFQGPILTSLVGLGCVKQDFHSQKYRKRMRYSRSRR